MTNPDSSYLTGRYHHNREILATMQVVIVPDIGTGWLLIDDQAAKAIKEIWAIYNAQDVTTEEAFDIWITNNLY